LEIEPISIKVVGRFSGVPAKKLYRWYKDVLSGYEPKIEGELAEHDIIEEGKIIRVPIFKPKHIGSDMTIDEKHIDKKTYTILANPHTGKIALLIQSLKVKTIVSVIRKFGDKCFEVKSLSRDLSQTYDWIGRQVFMNAEHVADKFHVLKHGFEALQNLRITYRQLELHRIKQLQDEHLKNELRIQKQLREKYNTSYRLKKFNYTPEVFKNGETLLQLLARSRYLLFKYPSEWSEEQKIRAKILFDEFDDLQKAYSLIISFRKWYKAIHLRKSRTTILRNLNAWYQKVKRLNIEHINVFRALVQRHQGIILNYFRAGRTNAAAEALNSRIQRFISINYGTRDIDFFLFRLAVYFS
jgi:transposase